MTTFKDYFELDREMDSVSDTELADKLRTGMRVLDRIVGSLRLRGYRVDWNYGSNLQVTFDEHKVKIIKTTKKEL